MRGVDAALLSGACALNVCSATLPPHSCVTRIFGRGTIAAAREASALHLLNRLADCAALGAAATKSVVPQPALLAKLHAHPLLRVHLDEATKYAPSTSACVASTVLATRTRADCIRPLHMYIRFSYARQLSSAVIAL